MTTLPRPLVRLPLVQQRHGVDITRIGPVIKTKAAEDGNVSTGLRSKSVRGQSVVPRQDACVVVVLMDRITV